VLPTVLATLAAATVPLNSGGEGPMHLTAHDIGVSEHLIDPRILIEIEVWAAKPIDGGN
jgi:hypothetical protein